MQEFISANSAWFIGIGIVLVFGLIGFIADKTSKNKKETIKEQPTEELPNVLVEENKEINSGEPINEEPIDEIYQPEIEIPELDNQEEQTLEVEQEQPEIEMEPSLELEPEEIVETENQVDNIEENEDLNNYESLSQEGEEEQVTYDSEDFSEIKNEVVENQYLIDKSPVAEQPEGLGEPLDSEIDLDDIWKI